MVEEGEIIKIDGSRSFAIVSAAQDPLFSRHCVVYCGVRMRVCVGGSARFVCTTVTLTKTFLNLDAEHDVPTDLESSWQL
jgi:hypothetical protein